MVFDKTGTLTEEGLTVYGFRSAILTLSEKIIGGDEESIVYFSDFKTKALDFMP